MAMANKSPLIGSNKSYIVFVSVCGLCIVAIRLLILFIESEPLTPHNHKVAVVYAGRTYHEEVTAAMACMLHSSGYHVAVYIENGISIGNFVLPFTQQRIRASDALYGHCVSEWITINNGMKIIDDPAILLFVTHPMLSHGSTTERDPYSFRLLSEMKRKDTKLVLVTHHIERFWAQVNDLSRYFDHSRMTFMFLANHVCAAAREELSRDPSQPAYNIECVFPVFKLSTVIGTEALFVATEHWKRTPDKVTFSIQGNFGGRHKHRKNINGSVNCLNEFGGELKNPNFTYVENLVHSNTNLRGFDRSEHLDGTVPGLQLDLVGHADGPLEQASQAVHFAVRSFSDLSSPDFYARLTKSKFLLTALGNNAYSRTQATSSVPAAVVSHVPLVTTAAFLALYPCLRDLPIHRRINVDNECDSIRNAYALSDEDYELARKEMQGCHQQLWNDGVHTFKRILAIENRYR